MTQRLGVSLLAGMLLAGCATVVHDGGIAYDNPYGVPERVSVPLPLSLDPVVAAGYRTQADNQGVDPTAKGVRDNLGIYTHATQLIDTILKAVAKNRPIPGRSYTFPDTDHPGKLLTVLLTVQKDHAAIAIGQGTSATGPGQVIAITYTSPRKGRAVLHTLDPDPKMGKFYLGTTFDLDQGTVTADGISDNTMVSPTDSQRFRGHWDFVSHAGVPAASSSFDMRASVFVSKPSDPRSSGVIAVSSSFLPDGGGAYILGVQNPGTNDRFLLVPNDGLSWTQPPTPPHDFYMSAEGQDIPAASASQALKAILPPDDSFARPFPDDPSKGDPFADPVFAFPQ